MKWLAILLAGTAMLALVPAGFAGQPVTQTLNPPPPPDYTCMATGSGTICRANNTESIGPEDTGLVCGTGAGAFDIFDQATLTQTKTRWYDQNGNLTRRVILDIWSSGQWSNPLSGATVPYTQHNVTTDVLAVPGDFTSSTQTITGENIYRPRTGAPVFLAVGRQVFNFDQSELISSAGKNAFIAAFFQGDTTAFDQICAALS